MHLSQSTRLELDKGRSSFHYRTEQRGATRHPGEERDGGSHRLQEKAASVEANHRNSLIVRSVEANHRNSLIVRSVEAPVERRIIVTRTLTQKRIVEKSIPQCS